MHEVLLKFTNILFQKYLEPYGIVNFNLYYAAQ